MLESQSTNAVGNAIFSGVDLCPHTCSAVMECLPGATVKFELQTDNAVGRGTSHPPFEQRRWRLVTSINAPQTGKCCLIEISPRALPGKSPKVIHGTRVWFMGKKEVRADLLGLATVQRVILALQLAHHRRFGKRMHPVQQQYQTATWHILKVRGNLPESCFEGEPKSAESSKSDDAQESDHSKLNRSTPVGPSREDCTAPLEPCPNRKRPQPDSPQPPSGSGARARFDSNAASSSGTAAAESARGAATKVATSPPLAVDTAAEARAKPDQSLDKADTERRAKESEVLDKYATRHAEEDEALKALRQTLTLDEQQEDQAATAGFERLDAENAAAEAARRTDAAGSSEKRSVGMKDCSDAVLLSHIRGFVTVESLPNLTQRGVRRKLEELMHLAPESLDEQKARIRALTMVVVDELPSREVYRVLGSEARAATQASAATRHHVLRPGIRRGMTAGGKMMPNIAERSDEDDTGTDNEEEPSNGTPGKAATETDVEAATPVTQTAITIDGEDEAEAATEDTRVGVNEGQVQAAQGSDSAANIDISKGDGARRARSGKETELNAEVAAPTQRSKPGQNLPSFSPRPNSNSPITVERSLKKSTNRESSRREVYLCRADGELFVRKVDAARRIANEVHALQQAALHPTPGLRVPKLIAHSDSWVDIEYIEGVSLKEVIGNSSAKYVRMRPLWLRLAELFHQATKLRHGAIKSHSVILLDPPTNQRRRKIEPERLVLIDFAEAQPAETMGVPDDEHGIKVCLCTVLADGSLAARENSRASSPVEQNDSTRASEGSDEDEGKDSSSNFHHSEEEESRQESRSGRPEKFLFFGQVRDVHRYREIFLAGEDALGDEVLREQMEHSCIITPKHPKAEPHERREPPEGSVQFSLGALLDINHADTLRQYTHALDDVCKIINGVKKKRVVFLTSRKHAEPLLTLAYYCAAAGCPLRAVSRAIAEGLPGVGVGLSPYEFPDMRQLIEDRYRLSQELTNQSAASEQNEVSSTMFNQPQSSLEGPEATRRTGPEALRQYTIDTLQTCVPAKDHIAVASTSETEAATTAESMAAEPSMSPVPYSGVIAVVGCHFRGFDELHPDELRLQSLMNALPQASVYGVAMGQEATDAFASPYSLTGNVRDQRMWETNARRDAQLSIVGRGTTLLILDYFWLTPTYLSKTEGYGDGWVTQHIPSLFRHGGQLAILPNDKWKQVEQMFECDHSLDFARLSLQEAEECHPLWHATRHAEQTVWDRLAKNSARLDEKTNAQALANYLDPDWPFVLCWNQEEIGDRDAALAMLGRMAMEMLERQVTSQATAELERLDAEKAAAEAAAEAEAAGEAEEEAEVAITEEANVVRALELSVMALEVTTDDRTRHTLWANVEELPNDQECLYHAFARAWGVTIEQARQMIADEAGNLDAKIDLDDRELDLLRITVQDDVMHIPTLVNRLFTNPDSEKAVLQLGQYKSYVLCDAGDYKSQAGHAEIRLLIRALARERGLSASVNIYTRQDNGSYERKARIFHSGDATGLTPASIDVELSQVRDADGNTTGHYDLLWKRVDLVPASSARSDDNRNPRDTPDDTSPADKETSQGARHSTTPSPAGSSSVSMKAGTRQAPPSKTARSVSGDTAATHTDQAEEQRRRVEAVRSSKREVEARWRAVSDVEKDQKINRYETAARMVLPTEEGSSSTGEHAMDWRQQQLEAGIRHVRRQLLDFRLTLLRLSCQELVQILENRSKDDRPGRFLQMIGREGGPLSAHKQALVKYVLLGVRHWEGSEDFWLDWMRDKMPAELQNLGIRRRNKEQQKYLDSLRHVLQVQITEQDQRLRAKVRSEVPELLQQLIRADANPAEVQMLCDTVPAAAAILRHQLEQVEGLRGEFENCHPLSELDPPTTEEEMEADPTNWYDKCDGCGIAQTGAQLVENISLRPSTHSKEDTEAYRICPSCYKDAKEVWQERLPEYFMKGQHFRLGVPWQLDRAEAICKHLSNIADCIPRGQDTMAAVKEMLALDTRKSPIPSNSGHVKGSGDWSTDRSVPRLDASQMKKSELQEAIQAELETERPFVIAGIPASENFRPEIWMPGNQVQVSPIGDPDQEAPQCGRIFAKNYHHGTGQSRLQCYPQQEDFAVVHPQLHDEWITKVLELFPHAEGQVFDVYRLFPAMAKRPDLGPKIFCTTGKGSTGLHCDVGDAFNYMLDDAFYNVLEGKVTDVKLPEDVKTKDQVGAIWRAFHAEHYYPILEMLRRKTGSRHRHTLQRETFSKSELAELAAQGIEPYEIHQRPGEVVRIPAKCWHWVENLSPTCKIAQDYLDPRRILKLLELRAHIIEIGRDDPQNERVKHGCTLRITEAIMHAAMASIQAVLGGVCCGKTGSNKCGELTWQCYTCAHHVCGHCAHRQMDDDGCTMAMICPCCPAQDRAVKEVARATCSTDGSPKEQPSNTTEEPEPTEGDSNEAEAPTESNGSPSGRQNKAAELAAHNNDSSADQVINRHVTESERTDEQLAVKTPTSRSPSPSFSSVTQHMSEDEEQAAMTVEEPVAQPSDRNVESHSADDIAPTLSTKSRLASLHQEFCWPCGMGKDSGTFHRSDKWREAPLVECEHRCCDMQVHQVRHAKGCPIAKKISQGTQRSCCGSCDELRDLTYVGLEAVPYRSACLVLSQHTSDLDHDSQNPTPPQDGAKKPALHPMIIEPHGVVYLSRCSGWEQAIAAVDEHLDAMMQPLDVNWAHEKVSALDEISRLDPMRPCLERLFPPTGAGKKVTAWEDALGHHLCSSAGTRAAKSKKLSTRAALLNKLQGVMQSEEGRAVIRFWRASLGSMQDGLFRQTMNSETDHTLMTRQRQKPLSLLVNWATEPTLENETGQASNNSNSVSPGMGQMPATPFDNTPSEEKDRCSLPRMVDLWHKSGPRPSLDCLQG